MPDNPVAHLRALSGLEMGQLATILNVTRTTCYKWLRGGTMPHEKHRRHLLRTTSLMYEAAARLGPGLALWLQTPEGSRDARPMDYLAEHRYEAFKGRLLRVPPPSWQPSPLPPEELARRLRLLQPRPTPEDYAP